MPEHLKIIKNSPISILSLFWPPTTKVCHFKIRKSCFVFMLISISHSNDRALKGLYTQCNVNIQIRIFLKILIHHSVIRAWKCRHHLKDKAKLLKKIKRVQVYLLLKCKLAFAFYKRPWYITLIHTEIPSIFSSNPAFPLVKFRFVP